MNNYQPEFTDKRVHSRTLKVLKFMCAQVSETKPQQLSRHYLDKVFGKQGNPLTDYLRSKCLIVCDSSYRFSKNSIAKQLGRETVTSYCKTYKKNTAGVNELITAIKADIKHKETKRKQILYSNANSSNAYCATSFELALEFAREAYSPMLSSGIIPYNDKKNRLWTNMQNLKKEVKQQLYAEHNYSYEYDIEACAPTLLYQYATKHGLKSSQYITYYLNNKSAVRNELATHYSIDIKIIKEVITSMFAGARFDKSIAAKVNDPIKNKALANNQFICGLKKDITKMWKKIKLVIGVRYKRDKVTRETKISSHTKWCVYFELERQVLDVVREYLSESGNSCILEHDGWTTSKKVDQTELNELIAKQTGFVIKTSEVILEDVCLVSWV
jgi:hypothetical protein